MQRSTRSAHDVDGGGDRVVTRPTNRHDRELLEAVRQACLDAAADAYEDAGIRGLCGDGRWECALQAIRAIDLDAVPTSSRRSE